MKFASLVTQTAVLTALCGVAPAQSQPTPGAPSQSFSPIAQAQNGGAGPQVTYQYGMEFVTIPRGNEAYPGLPTDFGLTTGRGAVSQDYRLGRYEVGRSAWDAFFAAVDAVEAQTGQTVPFITRPGGLAGNGPNGRVGNISWRTAAMYCNWLHNDQALTRDAFMGGAYDVSTFGYIGGQYLDQRTHSPDARFWIPTLDEWVRAAHFDPNRNGPGQGGWWQFSIGRDSFGIPGLPHAGGEVNAGFTTLNMAEFAVPLGAYSNIQSPWGLFDTIGQTTEWLEDPFFAVPGQQLPHGRLQAGAYLTSTFGSAVLGSIGHSVGQSDPSDDAYWMGFRLAAAIPAPGAGAFILLSTSLLLRRNRGASDCSSAARRSFSSSPSRHRA